MFWSFPIWIIWYDENFSFSNQFESNNIFNHLFTAWFKNIRVNMIFCFLTTSWDGAVAKVVGFESMVSRALNYPELPWFFDCVGAYSTMCYSNRRLLLMAGLMGVFAAWFDVVISNLKNRFLMDINNTVTLLKSFRTLKFLYSSNWNGQCYEKLSCLIFNSVQKLICKWILSPKSILTHHLKFWTPNWLHYNALYLWNINVWSRVFCLESQWSYSAQIIKPKIMVFR